MYRTTKYSPFEDVCMQFYGTFSCIHTSRLIDVRLCLKSSWHPAYGPKKNVIKLHIQIFLMMNTWMVETCQRQH